MDTLVDPVLTKAALPVFDRWREGEIRKLEDCDGILQSETMGIGDGENDIGMLQHCAIGIAMGNAADNTKKSADYVTDDIDKDGVYNALKHYGLI